MTGPVARLAAADRAIAAWLGAAADDTPPETLLALAMGSVRRTRQRPGWAARLRGASTGAQSWREAPLVPVWVGVALLVAAAIVVAGLAGALRSTEPPHVPAPIVPVRPVPPSSRPSRTNEPTVAPKTASPSTPSTSPAAPPSPTPAIIQGPGFTVALPLGWRRASGYNTSGRFTIGTGDFGGMLPDLISVDWGDAGDPIVIALGQQQTPVTISGHDLASLLESAKAAFPAASVRKVTIGGEPGWRVAVAQASYVMPLANLAIAWHAGTAFVVEEHLVVDGATTGDFGRVLEGISFE